MDPTAFRKIHPKEFYRKFLENAVRPSGRGLDHCRKVTISVGTMEKLPGSSLVRVGNTTCVCGIKLEVGVPTATAPDDGRLEVAVNLSPLCSSKFTIGAPSEQAVSIGQFLTDLVVSSKVIDLSHLGINSGKHSWVLYADIVCLDYDGNVVDAALMSLVAALGDLKIPETQSVEGESQVFLLPEGVPRSLKISHFPVPLSFICVDEFILADPTIAEEELSSASWTVVYNEQHQLVSIYKPGGASLGQEQLKLCLDRCKKRVSDIFGLYTSTLNKG